jgi:hypothetical protein
MKGVTTGCGAQADKLGSELVKNTFSCNFPPNCSRISGFFEDEHQQDEDHYCAHKDDLGMSTPQCFYPSKGRLGRIEQTMTCKSFAPIMRAGDQAQARLLHLRGLQDKVCSEYC